MSSIIPSMYYGLEWSRLRYILGGWDCNNRLSTRWFLVFTPNTFLTSFLHRMGLSGESAMIALAILSGSVDVRHHQRNTKIGFLFFLMMCSVNSLSGVWQNNDHWWRNTANFHRRFVPIIFKLPVSCTTVLI